MQTAQGCGRIVSWPLIFDVLSLLFRPRSCALGAIRHGQFLHSVLQFHHGINGLGMEHLPNETRIKEGIVWMDLDPRPWHCLDQLCQQRLHVLVLHHRCHGVGIKGTDPNWRFNTLIFFIVQHRRGLIEQLFGLPFSWIIVTWIHGRFLLISVHLSFILQLFSLLRFLLLCFRGRQQADILFILQRPTDVIAHLPEDIEGASSKSLKLRHGAICAADHVTDVNRVPQSFCGLLHDLWVVQHQIQLRTTLQELRQPRVHLQKTPHEVVIIQQTLHRWGLQHLLQNVWILKDVSLKRGQLGRHLADVHPARAISTTLLAMQ
mmetsp:Transcript_83310/g.131813  ORF Transcript_83310/g.131813 Transcript_83310/m.131813 type:complete len:319 (+) Transcript_83310:291-1247(+)